MSGIVEYINNFTFENAPLNFRDPLVTFVPVGVYLLITLLSWLHMRNKKPFALNVVAAIHNFILSGSSLVMFLGMGYPQWLRFKAQGFHDGLVCDSDNYLWTINSSQFWIWVFFVSKALEFVDSWIRVFHKKPLTVLHVWHHATVPIHLYLMLYAEWPPATFGFVFNAFVHITMYFYYGLVALGIRVWWKQLITVLQIGQFIFCLGITVSTVVQGSCPWNDRAGIALFSTFTFYLSYLVLFLNFYFRTYNNSKKRISAANTSKKAE